MKRRNFLGHSAMWTLAAATAVWHGPAQWAWAGGAPDPVFGQTFPGLDGKPFALSDCLGQPVVLNFWATWCPPCVKEMPDLESLHNKYGSVRFLGLAVDTAVNVKAFTENVHVSYPLLLVGHDGIPLMQTLGNKVGGLPFTVVFDAEGRQADRVLGQIKLASLERTLNELLG